MQDNRKRYKITCPYCGKVEYTVKSFMHELGVNDGGHGTCLDCKGFMKIVYNPDTDTMTAKEWVTS